MASPAAELMEKVLRRVIRNSEGCEPLTGRGRPGQMPKRQQPVCGGMCVCACVFIGVLKQRREAATSGLDIYRITVEQGDVPRDHRKMEISLGSTLSGWAWEQDQNGKEGGCKTVHSNGRVVKERDYRRGRELVEQHLAIPNGELEGVGGVTGYMDGILVMGTSHSREVLIRIEQFGFNVS